MKKLVFLSLLCLVSCTSVLRYETMQSALFNPPIQHMRQDPLAYQGKLFVFGGIIADMRITEDGSLIEAVYVPVDFQGFLLDPALPSERFLALYPRSGGILDPMIFKKGREVTIAGVLTGMRAGIFQEIEYVYPFFTIQEIYLWEKPYLSYRPYPYWWYDPWWYGPGPRYYWWR